MKTFEVNLNWDALVQLTELGQEELQRQGRPAPKEDGDGWSRWQFNDLISTFGDRHRLNRDCFSSIVRFVLPDQGE